jgi:hypothetical protein
VSRLGWVGSRGSGRDGRVGVDRVGVASELEERYQRLKEDGRALCQDREKQLTALASAVSRTANSVGPNRPLPWGDS